MPQTLVLLGPGPSSCLPWVSWRADLKSLFCIIRSHKTKTGFCSEVTAGTAWKMFLIHLETWQRWLLNMPNGQLHLFSYPKRNTLKYICVHDLTSEQKFLSPSPRPKSVAPGSTVIKRLSGPQSLGRHSAVPRASPCPEASDYLSITCRAV